MSEEINHACVYRENSRNGNLCTLGRDLLSLCKSKGTETSCGDSLVVVPDIISCQLNMFPTQRRQMF
jgi:hypothetical protein